MFFFFIIANISHSVVKFEKHEQFQAKWLHGTYVSFFVGPDKLIYYVSKWKKKKDSSIFIIFWNPRYSFQIISDKRKSWLDHHEPHNPWLRCITLLKVDCEVWFLPYDLLYRHDTKWPWVPTHGPLLNVPLIMPSGKGNFFL